MEYNRAPRVLCLYRVSTKQQLDDNDIPMQRKECRAFCQRKGWQLYREIDEKGVSGYSISLEDREAIHTIKEAVLRHEFDIFLVYMFDRIGRKEFEVPAFLRFLVDNGISVWSTQEGEQRFENDADSILAMLRSFTAQRESMKLSVRVHTKHMQMALAGEYRGGRIPFGYKTRNTSKLNRKGIPIKELIIDEPSAAIVRMIFEKRVYEKMGIYKIAKLLCDMNISGDDIPNWRASTISFLLSNRVYIGQLKFDGQWSMPFEHLRIVSNDLFFAAQSSSKGLKHAIPREKTELPEFYDLLFCAHCQGHLVFNAVHKVTTPHGKVNTRLVYRCYNKLRYSAPCTGQATYSKWRVDQLVADEIRKVLYILLNADEDTLICNAVEQEYQQQQIRIAALEKEIELQENEVKYLQAQMLFVVKQYGIEASTNLQLIITDKLSNVSSLKERLIKEKTNNVQRPTLKKRSQIELQTMRAAYAEYEQWTIDQLLAIAPTLFVQIKIGTGYAIKTDLTFQISSFLLQ